MAIPNRVKDDSLFRIGLQGTQETSSQSANGIVSGWERKAMELATRRRYAPVDTMHWHTSADGSTARYLVLADTSGIHHYEVTIHPESDHRHTCDCLAGGYQRPCKHVGICLILWAQFDRPAWADEHEKGAIA